MRYIDVFISHSWSYSNEYYRFEQMLNNASYFKWRNYSVPVHDPVIGTEEFRVRKLIAELDGQIRPVNVVVILAGMYVSHSSWIQKEIDIAKAYGKPILGVKPWGSERVPLAVQQNATELVGWNTDSIVAAIKRIAL